MSEPSETCLRCQARPSIDPKRIRMCEPCRDELRAAAKQGGRRPVKLSSSPAVSAWLKAQARPEGQMPGA